MLLCSQVQSLLVYGQVVTQCPVVNWFNTSVLLRGKAKETKLFFLTVKLWHKGSIICFTVSLSLTKMDEILILARKTPDQEQVRQQFQRSGKQLQLADKA